MGKKKNTGAKLEKEVYDLIHEIINKNEFMVSNPNVKIRKRPRYYSRDRGKNIEFDVSIEKYLADPEKNKDINPSIIIVIECKDYSNGIPVDDVEEFHEKLQQIGADNTKGMMITKNGCFQKSALLYAKSKGIALARIIPDNQIQYVSFWSYCLETRQEIISQSIYSLTNRKYKSINKKFFSLTGEESLEELIFCILKEK